MRLLPRRLVFGPGRDGMHPVSCREILGHGRPKGVHGLFGGDLFGGGSDGVHRQVPRRDLRLRHRRVRELSSRHVFECGRGHVGGDLHELRKRDLLRGRGFDLFRHLSRGNLRERGNPQLRQLCRWNVLGGRHRDHVHELPGRNVLGRDGCHVREHLHQLPRRDTVNRDRRDVLLRV